MNDTNDIITEEDHDDLGLSCHWVSNPDVTPKVPFYKCFSGRRGYIGNDKGYTTRAGAKCYATKGEAGGACLGDNHAHPEMPDCRVHTSSGAPT